MRRNTIITQSADNMHGRACVRGSRITVASVLRTLRDCDGDIDEVLKVYAHADLTRADVLESISYGAMLAAADSVK